MYFPQVPPACLSPVLWGCSWLPQGFLSRGPGLTGVTAHQGALFLRFLLLTCAPPRRPGQHAASGGRAGQHLCVPVPWPPWPLTPPVLPLSGSHAASTQSQPPSAAGNTWTLPVSPGHPPHYTAPRRYAGRLPRFRPTWRALPPGSRGRPLAVGSARQVYLQLGVGGTEQRSLQNLDLDPEVTPFPATHGFCSQTHTHTYNTHTHLSRNLKTFGLFYCT